jgi:hypothetical protein
MPFSAQELANIANAAIDFHMERGKVKSSTIQEKPLLMAMRKKQKTFPGGKDNLTVRVKGVYSTTIQGFEHDDEVSYGNPANIKTATYPWKLIHSGIKITNHELLKDGISVTDSMTGEKTSNHSDREMTALANLLDDKLEDMTEGSDRGYNTMYWGDGSSDPKLIPGVRSIIVDAPTAAGNVGGLDPVTNSWWRNRASLTISLSGTLSDQSLVNFLQNEYRQLVRYGDGPDLWLAGSDFMDRIERELRSKGDYTQDGWSSKGTIDFAMGDIAFKGKAIKYDPSLDDLGYAKRCYAIDTKNIFPLVVEGEDMKKHAPARPENKYVYYRAMTYVGGLVARRRNSSGVYAFA